MAAREKLRLTLAELNSANEKNVESAETFRRGVTRGGSLVIPARVVVQTSAHATAARVEGQLLHRQAMVRQEAKRRRDGGTRCHFRRQLRADALVSQRTFNAGAFDCYPASARHSISRPGDRNLSYCWLFFFSPACHRFFRCTDAPAIHELPHLGDDLVGTFTHLWAGLCKQSTT